MQNRGLLLFGFLPGLGVLATEALNAASRVDQLLFSGEERVASGANFYVDVALVGGPGGEVIAASAQHAHFVVGGMIGCLHGALGTSIRIIRFYRSYAGFSNLGDTTH